MFPNQPNHFRQARQAYHLEAELSVAFSFPLDPEKSTKEADYPRSFQLPR